MRALRSATIVFALSLAIAGPAVSPAGAQHNHARHHPTYQNWVNLDGKGCCNNMDCGELASEDERTHNGRLEVRVKGEWCPVLRKHYLKVGNAADPSTSHVCVSNHYGGQTPCDQLLCYQPKPGI